MSHVHTTHKATPKHVEPVHHSAPAAAPKIQTQTHFNNAVKSVLAQGVQHGHSHDHMATQLQSLSKSHPSLAKHIGLPSEHHEIVKGLMGPKASMASATKNSSSAKHDNKPKAVHAGQHVGVHAQDTTVRTNKNQLVLDNMTHGESVKILGRNKAGDMVKVSEGGTKGWMQRKALGLDKSQIMGLDVKKGELKRLTGNKTGQTLTILGGSNPKFNHLERMRTAKPIPLYRGIDDKTPFATLPAGAIVGKRIQTGEKGSKMLIMLPGEGIPKDGHKYVHVFIDNKSSDPSKKSVWDDPASFQQNTKKPASEYTDKTGEHKIHSLKS